MRTRWVLMLVACVLAGVSLHEGRTHGESEAAEDGDAAVVAASSPRPYVGAANVYPEGLVMSWAAVPDAQEYGVYSGMDPDALAPLGSTATPQLDVNAELSWGKCYYWRVDTRMSDTTFAPGPLWRFTIIPPLPADPDLLAWYAFDEVAGSASVDLSGNGVNALLEQMIRSTTGAPGLEGGSVRSDGSGYVRLEITEPTQPLVQATLTGWFRIGRQDEPIPLWRLTGESDGYVRLVPQPANLGGLAIEVKAAGQSQPVTAQASDPLPVDHWTHLAVTMDGAAEQIKVYEDGAVVLTAQGLTCLTSILETAGFVSIADSLPLPGCLRCSVDEVRLHARILDAQEIARTMLGHPNSPYEPNPRHRAQLHTSVPIVLRWQGTSAAHAYNVYTGTDVNHLDLLPADLTEPQCSLDQKLGDGQTLCWQVEAVVDGGFVRGPLWQFSVTSLSLEDIIDGARSWWADYSRYYRQVAPDVSLTDLDGRGHRVRDYRGSHLLLAVWAPWCSACRTELVTLSKLREKLTDDEMVLLAVTDESNRSALPAFLADHPEVNFPVCVTKLSATPPFSSVAHIPSIFYVAPDGTMKLATVGAVPQETIESILKAAWPDQP